MHYAYQACKGTQLIEFAGFVGRIRRSRRNRHNTHAFYCLFYRLLVGNDSNLLIVFYVQIMPDDFVMQLHR
ncbi:hypothetical protein MZG41_14060, partial [Escherichia coli]|nr:hypothetical protein [Escherichia coli]